MTKNWALMTKMVDKGLLASIKNDGSLAHPFVCGHEVGCLRNNCESEMARPHGMAKNTDSKVHV